MYHVIEITCLINKVMCSWLHLSFMVSFTEIVYYGTIVVSGCYWSFRKTRVWNFVGKSGSCWTLKYNINVTKIIFLRFLHSYLTPLDFCM